MVHVGHINKTTTLCIPTEEGWGQATADYHDLRYIDIILSVPEETPIDPK